MDHRRSGTLGAEPGDDGLLAAYFLDPEEFPESLFIEAFEAMAPE